MSQQQGSMQRRHKQHPRSLYPSLDCQACGWCRALSLLLWVSAVMASGPDQNNNSHSQSRLFPGITNDVPLQDESRVHDSGLSLPKDRLLLKEEVVVVDDDDDDGKRLGHEKQRPFRFLVDTQQRRRRQGKEDQSLYHHQLDSHHQAQSHDLSSNQVNRNPLSPLSLTPLDPNLKSVRDQHKSFASNPLMDSGRSLAQQNDGDAEGDYKDVVENENPRGRHLRTRRRVHHHQRFLNAMDDMHLHKGSQGSLTKRNPQQSPSPRATFHYSATSTTVNTNVVVKRKPSTTIAKEPPSDGYSDFVQDLRDEEILGESSSSSPYQLLNSADAAPTDDEDSKKVVEEVEATEVEEDWIEAEAEDGNGRQRGLEAGLDMDTRDIKSPLHVPSKAVKHVQTDRAHALGVDVRDQVMDATYPMDLLPLSSSDRNKLHNEDTTDDKELTNSQKRDDTEQRRQFQNDPTLVGQNSASFSVGRKAKSTTTVTVHHSQQSREDMKRNNETVVVEEVHMAIDLPSFQLLFAMPPDSMDAMDLLRVTRHHLGDQLETCPGFTRVEVFQLLRENSVAMETLTMVAFGGTAYFESTKKRLDVTDVVVQDLTWLAFLGQNNTEYIAELHDAGVEVEDATLYDLDGTMIVYQNGTMEFMGEDDDDGNGQDNVDTDGMDDMMSMTMIAVAVGVPAVVCVMVCFAYLWFYVHSRLDCHCCCFPKGRDPNDDIWLNPNVGEF